MKNTGRRWLIAVAATATLLAAGCGTSNSSGGGNTNAPNNPPFGIKTSLDQVTPNPAFDPKSASTAKYSKVEVLDAQGHHVTLDAHKQPILFEAYWCPHCQRTLKLFEKQLGTLPVQPVVVSMGFDKGTTLQDAVKLGKAESSALGLSGLTVYYSLDPNISDYVPVGFPTMVFNDHGTLKALYGEHTLQAWEAAFSVAGKSTPSA